MNARYKTLSIEAILEDTEDERQPIIMEKDDETTSQAARRHSRSWFDRNIIPNTANTGKERRKHRSSTSGSKHQSKSKTKPTVASPTTSSRKSRELARDEGLSSPRHRRPHSNRSSSSTSSSEEDEPQQNHLEVLAATRGRLTSPSVVSTFTTLTNKSNGSSGSNSTVTQASITKRKSLTKQPEIEEPPLSPAVPDAPDVFAFLDSESILEKDDDHQGRHSESESESDEEEEEDDDDDAEEIEVHWPASRSNNAAPCHPPHAQSSPSSVSSSFHGEDDFSSPAADNETDRSTSPEQSVKDHDSDHEDSPATDPVSVKIASQMAAAQQRQNLYESLHPNLQRVNTNIPVSPSSAMTPRYQAPSNPIPRSPAENFPVTGYELLAYKLSSQNPDIDDGAPIKPMYRKFGALNHRVLLYLQDEISELEEALHRLDQAETQSRKTDRHIIPASRRAAAQSGGELQWHKTDILNKIGYKLSQYNQALSSFHTTQSLSPPDPQDISAYRTYLQTENPIAEAETHFLDPTDDLVSVYSDNLRAPPSHRAPSYAASTFSNESPRNSRSPPSTFPPSPIPFDFNNSQQSALPGLASALAASVLVPIVVFNVIPNYIGRLTVTLLVAVGLVGALIQSRILNQGALFRQESIICAGIYGGVMIVLAGIL